MSLFKREPWQPKQKVGLERIELAPDPTHGAPPYGSLGHPGPGWEPRTVPGNGLQVWLTTAASPADAITVWDRARADHASGSGWWPVLVDATFWACVAEPSPAVADPAATGAEWLARALYGGESPLADRIPRGMLSWPGGRADRRPTNPMGTPDVLLVPAAAPWLVPEVLGWAGARKWGVFGPQHTLVLRRWAGTYGAEVLGLGGDDLYLRVRTPPARKLDAWLAAVEMVAYCPETIDEDSTLEDEASVLVNGTWTVWFDLSDDEDDEDEGDQDEGDQG